MTRDIVFAFIGGGIIGAAGTVGVMKRLGYIQPTPEQQEVLSLIEREKMEKERGEAGSRGAGDPMLGDTVSFQMEKELDTHKVRYDTLEDKPDLESLVKKYEEVQDQIEMDEEEEDIDEEDGDPNPELAYVIQTDEDEPQEYGHVIKQLPSRRKDQLIFLVPQDYAGEVYYLEDLIYYAEDDVLADVTDAPVDDQLGVIGDSLGYFGQHGADEDKLFVRNCTLGIEYEVTRVPGRYADKIYGLDVERMERNRGKRIGAKRIEEEEE